MRSKDGSVNPKTLFKWRRLRGQVATWPHELAETLLGSKRLLLDDIIDDGLVLWGHHDEGYTEIVDRTTPEEEAGQLQLAIAKHMILP